MLYWCLTRVAATTSPEAVMLPGADLADQVTGQRC